MAVIRSVFHCVGTTLFVGTIPVVTTVAVGVKVFSLIPLLIRWHCPLSEIPGPALASLPFVDYFKTERSEQSQEYLDAIHDQFGSVVRIGPRHIAISDLGIVRQVMDDDVDVLKETEGIARVIARSDTYIRGYGIPRGTVMILSRPSIVNTGKE